MIINPNQPSLRAIFEAWDHFAPAGICDDAEYEYTQGKFQTHI